MMKVNSGLSNIFQMVIANSDMPKVEQYQEANAKYEGKEKRLKS